MYVWVMYSALTININTLMQDKEDDRDPQDQAA